MKDKRILMILNEFPPTAQSGVQRGLKFLKYSIKLGWEAHVIAPKSPIRYTLDPSLMSDIPPKAHLHYIAGLGIKTVTESRMVNARFAETAPQSRIERMFWGVVKLFNDLLFPYDKQIGWMPFALIKAIKLINHYKFRKIFISAFPYSSFLVGIALKLIYKDRIFWIADYRDAWQFAPLLDKYVLPFRHRIICRTDDLTLRKCDIALFATERTRERYIMKHPWLKNKSSSITNGFDEDDFSGMGDHFLAPRKFPSFSLVYMGKLHISYGSPLPLLEAMRLCCNPDCTLVHIGSVDSFVQDSVEKAGLDNYRFEGYKLHNEALSYSLGADINIIIIGDAPEAEHWFPGKLFELLRVGKPILAIGPKQSVIAEVLTATNAGKYCYRNDLDSIVNGLNSIINNPESYKASQEVIKQYSREGLTEKLLNLYPD